MDHGREVDGATSNTVFACTLPPPELRRRRIEVLAGIRDRVKRIDETESGFVFAFDRAQILKSELDEFIRFEAACCSFIQMVVVDVAEAGFEVRMTAPTGAKPFIQAEFIDIGAPTAFPPASGCGCKA
jgi:hypothetical protein